MTSPWDKLSNDEQKTIPATEAEYNGMTPLDRVALLNTWRGGAQRHAQQLAIPTAPLSISPSLLVMTEEGPEGVAFSSGFVFTAPNFESSAGSYALTAAHGWHFLTPRSRLPMAVPQSVRLNTVASGPLEGVCRVLACDFRENWALLFLENDHTPALSLGPWKEGRIACHAFRSPGWPVVLLGAPIDSEPDERGLVAVDYKDIKGAGGGPVLDESGVCVGMSFFPSLLSLRRLPLQREAAGVCVGMHVAGVTATEVERLLQGHRLSAECQQGLTIGRLLKSSRPRLACFRASPRLLQSLEGWRTTEEAEGEGERA